MSDSRSTVVSAFALVVLTLASPLAFGQATSTGSLVLEVEDAYHAVLPGSQLTLTNSATGVTRHAETLKTGNYTFEALPYGTYTLTVIHDGFETANFDRVVIQTGVSTRVNVAMKVGSMDQKIEVSSLSVPVIETSSNTLSTTIDVQQIQNLPISGRDVAQLAFLVPGYTSTGAGSSDGTFSGMAQSTVSGNIDGVNSTSARFKSGYGFYPAVSPQIEHIQQLTVQTGELDPSQGAGQSAAQILFTTNAGTNKLHGQIFEDHQNRSLDANSWYNKAYGLKKAPLIINNFGGSLGGPILKNRLFFFLDFSESIQPAGATITASVPTAAAIQGNYSYYNACSSTNASQCSQSTLNVYQIAGASGFPTTINPVVEAQLKANEASYQYGTLTSTTADLNRETLSWIQPQKYTTYLPAGRLDWTISPKHSMDLSANYNQIIDKNIYASTYPGPDFASQNSGSTARNYVLSLGETWTIKPTLLNQLGVGYLYTAFVFSPEFEGRDISAMQNQGWAFSTSGVVSTTSGGSYYPYLTLTDNLSWQKNAHSFKFGGNIYHQQDHYYNAPLGYNNYYTGVSYNDPVSTPLLNAIPTSGAATPSNLPGVQGDIQSLYGTLTGRLTYVGATYALQPATDTYAQGTFNLDEVTIAGGFYAMDSWKVRPELTLNYGLRWDMINSVHDKNHAYTSPDVSSLWGPSGVGNLFKPGILTGNQNPAFITRGSTYNASLRNPEPQVGLAWNPRSDASFLGKLLGDSKSVVRASFTLKNYTEGGQNFWAYASDGGFNFFQGAYLYPDTTSLPGVYKPGSLALGDALPAFGLSPASYAKTIPESELTFTGQGATAINPNIRQPYVESWALGFQRQLTNTSAVEIRYVGNHGVHSWLATNYNQVNIAENGFLQEFQNAQANLAINAASGHPGDFENHGNGKPIPLITQALGGPGAADFTNGTFVNYLNYGAAGTFSGTLAGTASYFCNIVGAGFSPCNGATNVVSSSYPINYFQANPYMAGAGATLLDSNGMSNYNALQVEFRQQTSHGLEFNANYTYAKTLGTTVQRQIANYATFYDLHNPRLNYLPSAYDIRNTFHANGTYALPFGHGKAFLSRPGLLDEIVGGWTIGSIVQYQSGNPLILYGGFATVNGAADSGVDFAGGASARSIQKSVRITRDTGGNPWVNFVGSSYRGTAHANYTQIAPHQTAGTFGHLNYLYGPKWINTDMALTKAFTVHGRLKLNFQGEFLNVFNHPAFGIGDTGVQDATFGTTASLLNGPRQIELRSNITF